MSNINCLGCVRWFAPENHNQKFHDKACQKRHSYEIVTFCDVCDNGIRRRDSGACRACDMRERRRVARSEPRLPCSIPDCDNDARPLSPHCSKHENDIKRYGEPRPYQIDRDWAARENPITQSQVNDVRDRLLVGQGGECALCGITETPDWHLDHDHRCCSRNRRCWNCVRGVLCRRCNVALGMFDDDPESLRRAAGYLESSSRMNLSV